MIPFVKPVPLLVTMSSKLSQSPDCTPIPGPHSAPIDTCRSVSTSAPVALRLWLLNFEPRTRPYVEPLLGYTGSADLLTQVQLQFSTLEAAINYDRGKGMNFFVQQDVSERRKGRKHQPSLKYSQVPTECGQPYCLPKEEPAAGAAGPVA